MEMSADDQKTQVIPHQTLSEIALEWSARQAEDAGAAGVDDFDTEDLDEPVVTERPTIDLRPTRRQVIPVIRDVPQEPRTRTGELSPDTLTDLLALSRIRP